MDAKYIYLLLILALLLGFKAGRWDAIHGRELGLKHGKQARQFLIAKGLLKPDTLTTQETE